MWQISFHITNLILDKRRPPKRLREAAQNIVNWNFLSPAIPTNYNLTNSTQPPNPQFSLQEISTGIEHVPSGKASERRKRLAAGHLISSHYIPGDSRRGAGEISDSEADISSGVYQQPERPTAWLQGRQICGYSHLHAPYLFPGFLENRKHYTLLQKGGKDQQLATSYSPISLLPTVGKVLEKLMTHRLIYHRESINNLNDRQHGFRKGKSVDTAVYDLISKIQIARRQACLSALY
ncbi:hypothetical protein AVEN_245391-1 [Araneus ventricosus]|uniref:Reverse transcriptase domain-containing protein n=1 Tax=Araneus ventricosus TaxID=182803 RepID=A0A4Y2M6V7_ARAVE|nr:hypothetical protein AVEN_245391-1 [Araneus ventricosus]